MAGNDKATLFRPDDVVITLQEQEYRLVYDLNAFIEIEKIYDSVDSVLQMLLGATDGELPVIMYEDKEIEPDNVFVGEITLSAFILGNMPKKRATKHADTLNLLYIGLMHDYAIYNEHEEITGYSISKAKIGSMVTFSNLKEVTSKIVVAILKDLLPPREQEEVKNEEAPAPTRLANKNPEQ